MKKMNNKGFSLVELIIVIAIMAILLVVLAPQYLKYVERSRNSTDLQNAAEIVSALQIYAADPDSTVAPAAGSITIGTADQTPATGSFAAAALADAGLLDASGVLHTRRQSRTNWEDYTITWTVNNGNLNFQYSADNEASADLFSNRMLGATN
ncbi:MAG: type II secretion system GspH family protein [Lachnospiraceae bacterium]|nr:type II secretion system GspH family protein [Lachnospiraceae bacterium]